MVSAKPYLFYASNPAQKKADTRRIKTEGDPFFKHYDLSFENI